MSWLESFSNAIKESIASKIDKKEAYKVLAKKDDLFSRKYSDLLGAPSISKAGLSGNYRDLDGKPTDHLMVDFLESEVLLDQDGKNPNLMAFSSIVDGYMCYALGLDDNNRIGNMYMIDPTNEEGLFCYKIKTNLADFSIPTSGLDRLYVLWDSLNTEAIYCIPACDGWSSSYNPGLLFYAKDSDISYDNSEMYMEFHKSEWPSNAAMPSGIVELRSYFPSRMVYVATVASGFYGSGKKMPASAFFSEDMIHWQASDLYIDETYPTMDLGYHNVVTNIPTPDREDQMFLAISFSEQPNAKNHGMAYSLDGEHWEYASLPDDFPSACRNVYVVYDWLNMEYRAFTNRGIYTSKDLSTWKKINDISLTYITNVNLYSRYIQSSYKICYLVLRSYGPSAYIEGNRALDLGTSEAIIGNSFNDKVYTVSMDTDTQQFMLNSYKFGIVDSSINNKDMTKKVAEYVSDYLNVMPAPPSSDGAYNLKCTVVDGVPTYTWVEESESNE